MTNPLEKVKRLMALAETGIVFAANEFELERCQEQREVCLQLISEMTDTPFAVIDDFYMPPLQYPTPKVDVRAFVLNSRDQVLLAKESMDGRWSIPGGWSDIGFSPKEVVEKEVFEETGLHVTTKQLLAVWDKKHHLHPASGYHIYKMAFWCVAEDCTTLNHGFDILDVGFFDIDKLPPLSENRILETQIRTLYEHVKSGKPETLFE